VVLNRAVSIQPALQTSELALRMLPRGLRWLVTIGSDHNFGPLIQRRASNEAEVSRIK
jgi:hypothetical protein